ncbi:hypothetical protein ACLMJK_008588 [Lecanora helva]
MSTPFSLVSLPSELQEIVITHLNIIDKISLRLTCHYFSSIISPLTSATIAEAQQILYSYRDPHAQGVGAPPYDTFKRPYLACMSCHRLRPSNKFLNNQLRAKPTLKVPRALQLARTKQFGVMPNRYRDEPRYCYQCEAVERKVKKYRPGAEVDIEHSHYVVCRCAGELKQANWHLCDWLCKPGDDKGKTWELNDSEDWLDIEEGNSRNAHRAEFNMANKRVVYFF